MEDEDYDPDIKDEFLRPASTRSKIVVNLKEPQFKRKKQFGRNDPIKYELDAYDKVRMQLFLADEKLYKQYEETIKELEEKPSLQPRKKQMPIYMDLPLLMAESIILILFFYIFFLIVQLALFNLVIIGILVVF
jgi:hypothetical protein